MFQQDITLGPGNGTFTSHTLEIFIMLFVAFLLGAWLGWVMWNRYQAEAEQLRLDLTSANATLVSLRTEVDTLRNRFTTAEGEITHLRAENENLQRDLTASREKLASTDALLAQSMTRNRQLETELGLSLGSTPTPPPDVVPLEVVQNENIEEEISAEENKTEAEVTPAPTEPVAEPAPSTIRVVDRATDQVVTVRLDHPSPNVEIQLEGGLNTATTEPPAVRETATDESVFTPGHPLLEPSDPASATRDLPPAVTENPVLPDPSEMYESPGFIAIDTLHGRDNLQMVEGIGPAEEDLLNQNGIYSYLALSQLNAAVLENLLQAAGRTFTGIDPATWPAQANLAATGQWEALRSVQGIMRSGKKPT